jgi:hypothetical protein
MYFLFRYAHKEKQHSLIEYGGVWTLDRIPRIKLLSYNIEICLPYASRESKVFLQTFTALIPISCTLLLLVVQILQRFAVNSFKCVKKEQKALSCNSASILVSRKKSFQLLFWFLEINAFDLNNV